jgi:rubrerythrin
MSNKPDNMPADFESALGYIMSVTAPTIDDFKLMAWVELGGEAFYEGIANGCPNQDMKDLMNRTGREERAHAHRLKRVIEKLSGEAFEVPGADENPYHVVPEGIVVDADFLNFLMDAEYGGDGLYQGWAKTVEDTECADLLLQNGKEETNHGNRAKEMLALL